MEDQNNQTVDNQQEKTFTQDQVNAIIGKRLAEQKTTQEADLVKRDTELNQREMSLKAKELLQEKGLPKDLADVLRYDNEESLVKAIETIERSRGFKNNQADPTGKKHVIENKLEFGIGYDEPDPIGNAFKMKGNEPWL